MITTQDFQSLARTRGEDLISIYLPTHRSGAEVEGDSIRLKNLIREARSRADDRGVGARRADSMLKPIEKLIGDARFWNHQGDGLALFATPDGMERRRLPINVEQLAYVGDRLCVRPLLPAVAGNRTFYVLALSQNQVRLLACTREGAREMDLHDIPESLSEALGYDWEQKSLQFHTGTRSGGLGGERAAIFHGHGRGVDDAKDELEQFLHRVDNGLIRLLEDRAAPLVVAAVEAVAAKHRSLSHYPRLIQNSIDGNPEHLSADELHHAALEIVAPELDREHLQAIDRLRSVVETDRAVVGVETALSALRDARISDLFLRAERPLWGAFNAADGDVQAHDQRADDDDDLLDLAVSLALDSGARIHTLHPGDVPSDPLIAGLVRF